MTSKDVARLMISLVLFLLSAAVFSYLVYRFGPNPMALQNSVTLSELLMQEGTPVAMQQEIAEETGDVAGVADEKVSELAMEPVQQPSETSDQTIDYVRTETGVALRFNGRTYSPQVDFEPQPVELEQEELLPWSPFVTVPGDGSQPASIFSFLATEDTNNATFVTKQDDKYSVYAYREYATPKIIKVHTFGKAGEKIRIPKIFHLSQDGNYAAFALYTCYECGNEVPETLVVNLTNGSFRNIGKTATFTWRAEGAYEYKEYQETECPGDIENAMCAIDPQFLEAETGQI